MTVYCLIPKFAFFAILTLFGPVGWELGPECHGSPKLINTLGIIIFGTKMMEKCVARKLTGERKKMTV